jgi:hypothetical protein
MKTKRGDRERLMDLFWFWEQWFREVEALELSLAEPVSEYEEGLLAKYRQQGLEL